jgi:hypothetical protein
MNMRVTILIFAIAGMLFAQPQDQIVTNQTVVEMVRAGVAQDLIIDTISKSECRFLLDPANLVWLKNAGVADDVVRAMAAKESGKQAASPEFTQAKTPSPSVPTASRASLTPQLAQTPPPRAGSPRIYIESQGGFESYLSAAMVKKHVPAVVTQNKDEAMFALTSAVQSKEESTGSKVARCLFLYCAGVAGTQTATVQLINIKTQEVAWAYNVRKGSARAYQSTAESVAKHLKEFLEKHPQ